MMRHKYSVSPYLFAQVIQAAYKMGYTLDSRYAKYNGYQSRVPLNDLCQLFDRLQSQSGDPNIGFHIGQVIEPACFNIVGHLVMACNTIGEALPLVKQFQCLVIDCADVECRVAGDSVVFSWTPATCLYFSDRAIIDFVLSATRAFAMWATGADQAVIDVQFQYQKPKNTAVCQHIFGHPGIYGCDSNGFRFPGSWQQQAIRTGCNNIKPLLYHHAIYLLENMKNAEQVIGHLVEVLLNLLPEGYFNIERVAQVMNVSTRTLQRNLNVHATSFSAVLQKVRYRQANHLIKNTDLTLNEIAARLGYKEQSSFSSAYKHWAGITPSQAREHLDQRDNLSHSHH